MFVEDKFFKSLLVLFCMNLNNEDAKYFTPIELSVLILDFTYSSLQTQTNSIPEPKSTEE